MNGGNPLLMHLLWLLVTVGWIVALLLALRADRLRNCALAARSEPLVARTVFPRPRRLAHTHRGAHRQLRHRTPVQPGSHCAPAQPHHRTAPAADYTDDEALAVSPPAAPEY